MSDPMTRLNTALEGRYRIEREIGVGGMATVYLAKDLKHNRNVALKVLQPELSAVVGSERFLSEIETTANLQHPNILPLFDSGDADGLLFYVMPFVEGESLREKLDREKQLSVEESVRIATDVAEALQTAHEQGVIHRDIKPANILLSRGKPLVADFGIALAVSAAGGARLTETGLSIGTPQYMSPEQGTGDREVDERGDIYSLACVLYEMLAGDPPHIGSTLQAVIAKVITDRPRPITEVRDSVPNHTSAALHKGLAKVPADRFASAQAFAVALGDSSFAVPTTSAGASPSGARGWWAGGWLERGSVVALVLIAAAIAWVVRPTQELSQRPVQFFIHSDSTHRILNSDPAISPDGSVVVYQGRNGDQVMLFQRRLDDLESRPIPGTEGGDGPFFSPNGEWFAFWRNRTLLKTRLDGGMPLTIAIGSGWDDATWGPEDRIVFSSVSSGRVFQVSANGGTPEPYLPLDTLGPEISVTQPHFIPGEHAILFTDGGPKSLRSMTLYVADLASGDVRSLGPGAGAKYIKSGHLVYVLPDGSLVLQRFDRTRLETIGQATRLEWDASSLYSFWPRYDVSPGGALVVNLRGSGRRLHLVDRDEGERILVSSQELWVPRFSPDGSFIAYADLAEGEQGSDIWVYNQVAETETRLTLDAQDANDPVWSPDGRFLAISNRIEKDLYIMSVEAPGEPRLVLAREDQQWTSDWSDDGRYIVFTEFSNETDWDIWTIELDGDSVPQPFLVTDFNETAGNVSPDGRWLAYQSDESGQYEVYVQSFPGQGNKVRISADGGEHPVWSPDNPGLYFWNRGQLFEVSVNTDDGFEFGARQPVLQNQRYLNGSPLSSYDVHPNGQEFVILTTSEEGSLVWAVDMLGGG